jgi:hypothetical protein
MMYPQLRRLSLDGTPLDWTQFSLNNLEMLTIKHLAHDIRPSMATLRKIILANAHSLKRLEISSALPREHTEPLAPIYLPSLRELSLGYTFPEEVLPLVRTLRMPNLTSFELCDVSRLFCKVPPGHEQSSDATGIIQAILTQTPNPLAQLDHLELRSVLFVSTNVTITPVLLSNSILQIGLSEHMPLRLFQELTSLKSLELDEPDDSTIIALAAYMPNQNTGVHYPFVFAPPALTHLRFSATPVEQLLSFFQARTSLVKSLASFHLNALPVLKEVTLDGRISNEFFKTLASCQVGPTQCVTNNIEILPVMDMTFLDSDSESDGFMDEDMLDMMDDVEYEEDFTGLPEP